MLNVILFFLSVLIVIESQNEYITKILKTKIFFNFFSHIIIIYKIGMFYLLQIFINDRKYNFHSYYFNSLLELITIFIVGDINKKTC